MNSPRDRRPRKKIHKHSASTKRLGIVAALILMIGIGLAVKGGFEAKRAVDSRGWPSTTGTVIHTDVHEVQHHNEEYRGSSFYPKVLYRYTVYGESYTADRLTFGGDPGSNRVSAKKIVDKYPVGMTLTVYYDPNDPSVAVLNIGTSPMAYGMVGAGLVLIAVGGFSLRAWKRKRSHVNIYLGR